MEKLLTRTEFREGVSRRDGRRCVICRADGQDSHHILERRLFAGPDELGGYFTDNGATLCAEHHVQAEETILTCEQIREAAGITRVVLPSHLYDDARHDKWGNQIEPNGTRLRGELFYDESVQKILAQGGVLGEFLPYTRYQRTYHLPWSNMTKDDRMLDDLAPFEGQEVVVTAKMDGCFHSLEKVTTDWGPVDIGRIVRDHLPVRVLTYNASTGRTEFKPITAYHRAVRNRPWLSVAVRQRKHAAKPKFIVCTDTHRFLTQSGWKAAKDLHLGEDVFVSDEVLSREQRQVILGGLLGDSSVYRRVDHNCLGFAFGHSVAQGDHFEFKMRLLGGLVHETSPDRGGFPGSKMQRRAMSRATSEITDLLCEAVQGRTGKVVTDELLNEIDALGIAVWYLDDGNCSRSAKQRPRANIATNGFPMEDAQRLADMLKGKWGVACKVFDRKGPRIELSADGTARLFDIIHQFVPPCMRYKLAGYHDGKDCVLENVTLPTVSGLTSRAVVGVSDVLPARTFRQLHDMYDLTVEGNHNYFVNGVLVHNSNITMYPDYIHGRSVKPLAGADSGMVKALHAQIRHDIPAGWRLCGENLYVRHSISYQSLPAYFLLFSVWDERNECLSWDETAEWAEMLGLRTVPLLYRGSGTRPKCAPCTGLNMRAATWRGTSSVSPGGSPTGPSSGPRRSSSARTSRRGGTTTTASWNSTSWRGTMRSDEN